MLVSSAYLSRWPWLPSDLHQKICMHQVLDKPASMPIVWGCVHGKDTTLCSPASSLGCLSQLTHEKAHPQLLVRVTVGTANCFQFLKNIFFFLLRNVIHHGKEIMPLSHLPNTLHHPSKFILFPSSFISHNLHGQFLCLPATLR